jgi:peptidoglycan hydrolase CwlO-like protein
MILVFFVVVSLLLLAISVAAYSKAQLAQSVATSACHAAGAAFKTVGSDVADIQGQLETLRAYLDVTNSKLDEVDSACAEWLMELDERSDDIEADLEALDDRVEQNLDGAAADVVKLEQRSETTVKILELQAALNRARHGTIFDLAQRVQSLESVAGIGRTPENPDQVPLFDLKDPRS